MNHPNWPVTLMLLGLTALILGFIATARRRTLFIRRIPGLSAVDEAVGRGASGSRASSDGSWSLRSGWSGVQVFGCSGVRDTLA
jgi:hypothetical protein